MPKVCRYSPNVVWVTTSHTLRVDPLGPLGTLVVSPHNIFVTFFRSYCGRCSHLPEMVAHPALQHCVHAILEAHAGRQGQQVLVVERSQIEADGEHQLAMLPVAQLHQEGGGDR